MRNYIILNNKKSDTISGLIIQELPPISKPAQRTQIETIDGRDGDIVTPLGYAAYDKTFTIGLYGTFDINEIIAYFATQGQVIFSNEPNKYYNYQIVDQIDYERLVRYKVATVTMHVQPFKYSSTEAPIIVDSSDTVSGEGSDIALANTAEAPFNVLRHKGNATQKTYTGKNLFSFDAGTIGQFPANGLIIERSPNAITIEANTTNGAQHQNISMSGFDATKTYTISCVAKKIVKGTDGQPRLRISIYASSDGSTWANIATAEETNPTQGTEYILKKSFSGYAYYRFYFYNNSYTPVTIGEKTTYYNIQVEEGAQESQFEPYVGGIPSPNPDYPQDINVVTGDSTVKICSKNLFDNTITPSQGADVLTPTANGLKAVCTNTGGYIWGAIIIGKRSQFVGKTLTLKAEWINSSANRGTIGLGYCNANASSRAVQGTTITASGDSRSYVITDNDETKPYIYLIFYANAGGTAQVGDYVDYTSIMLNIGSTAAPYEPYIGQSYVLPLGDTYLAKIGDYVDEPVKVDGTWYIRRAIGKVVLDGTDAGYHFLNGVYYSNTAITRYFGNAVIMSDYFLSGGSAANTTTAYANGNNKISINTTDKRSLYLRNDNLANDSDWQTWLSTHNTTVYYVLATPTDEAITDQDLIDALDEFFGQAHAYKGQTNITASAPSGIEPAVLSVDVNEDNESTVTNAGNTTSRPILTIYGQGDIGVYINDVEVLQVALGDEGYITLDSVEMEAYKDSTANLKNRLVTGDYSKLTLNAGANKIRFTGIVTKYEIDKYSRWL